MMSLIRLTQEFEKALGAPYNPANLYSNHSLLALDQESEFPNLVVNKLNDWGLAHYYIPEEYGGKLKGYDQLFHLIRLASRRDLTVAIGHGKTMLGAVAIWVAGCQVQRETLAECIRQHHAIALALTEQQHGSDISATTTTAHNTENGFILNGEKYLINNARRSKALTVFARTGTENNARDFSIFWVDKVALTASQMSYLPKLLTHGIKGADISGIRFHNAKLPLDSLVGAQGQGLEIILKSFQITRTLCTALSCGAGDHALRIAWNFATKRRIYSGTLAQLLLIERQLTHAAIDLLIADCVSLFCSRAINVLPQQMSIISAAAKGFIPTCIEAMVDHLVDVLGARAYLEGSHEYGEFSKLQRDCRLISLFDGNTIINLQMLIVQLPALARNRQKKCNQSTLSITLQQLFSFDYELPHLNPNLLKISSKGQDDIVAGLFNTTQQLEQISNITPQHRQRLASLIEHILNQLQQIDTYFLNTPATTEIKAQTFKQAENYSKVFAAACCIHAFIYANSHLQKINRDGSILANCLERLVGKPLSETENLKQLVDCNIKDNKLISIFEFPLTDMPGEK